MNFEATAERIIRLQGLSFAMAACTGRAEDLKEARRGLKAAIIEALAAAELSGQKRGNEPPWSD
jgi:hypothetical protein